jgi:hypothetical protein
MRARMSGGVGGGPGEPARLPDLVLLPGAGHQGEVQAAVDRHLHTADPPHCAATVETLAGLGAGGHAADLLASGAAAAAENPVVNVADELGYWAAGSIVSYTTAARLGGASR